MMKINFTKKEYETLVEMLEIANWIIDSDEETDKVEDGSYEALSQKLLSYAKDFGFDEYVTYDKEVGKYFTTADFEQNRTMKHIEVYDDYTFWHELSYRLAIRDLLKEYSEEKLRQMENYERYKLITGLEEKYNDEFENVGIDNLEIVK
jgi:hypothetical protein